ncbi:FAD-dependent monooxygenase [Ruania zhangjianzhongii]|uniref:FAD-dependent monooxygenase n=1 Tax=Ruania zhangjianzhongii TaxID=2603206 RepID=UPI0011CA3465|nr:FAD-dependent monooxygenase [Ruania zhangjianzhongii]
MKALICGAGIAGLALANRLDAHGWDVIVLERTPGPREEGYMVDFSGPGFEAITAMGLREQLLAAATSVGEFRYIDRGGRATVSLDYDRFVTALDGEIVSIMRPTLEHLLQESLSERVDVRYGLSIDEVTDQADSATAVLTDGTPVTADLVVGADGVHSRVRAQILGPERDYLRYLGMHTGAFIFHDPELFDHVHGRFVLTETLDRQMGFYGLSEGQVAVFTVHRTADPTRPEDPRAELRSQFAGMGDMVDRALRHCPPPAQIYYDQVAQILAPRWHTGHVALVGDAAYAVSLVAGQGASLGIAGAYVLAEMLAAHATVPEALAEYDRRWRPVATEVQDSARDRVVEWFLPTSRLTLLLRRWGFRAMKLPGLSKVMVGSLLPKDHQTVTELASATHWETSA